MTLPPPPPLLSSSLPLPPKTSPTTPNSPDPTWPHLPNPIRQLPLALPLPHGGPKARPLTAVRCPGLHGACAPLAPPTSAAPGEERDSGGVNIAVVHSGSSLLPETAAVGGTGSSPGSLLLQLCELLATTPLQGLVFEEERPPPPNRAPLAPMLEFVSAQTGVPVVAVGGGASLGREQQESGSIYLQFTCSTALQLEVIFEVLEEYDWTSFSVVTTRHHGYEDFLAMVEGMTDGSFIGWEKKSVVILNVTDDPGGARIKRLLKDNEAQKMRTYLESYLNLGFMEGTAKTRPECVICREKLANDSMKPCKMKRHQQTMHPETVGRDRDFFIKKQQLAKANKPMDIRTAFVRAGSDVQKATEASFECALLIAKAKKPHNIGEQLIKPAYIKMVEKLCGPQVAEKLKTVPLSNNTALDAFVRKLEYRVGKMEREELQQFPLLLKQSRNNHETVPVSVRLLYCSLEEAELIFQAALAAGQAGPSHMWFAVGPALSGLGLEGLPKALFAIRPQGWRDEPRRRIAKGVSVLTHGAMALRRDQGSNSRAQYAGNCQTDGNQTHRVPDRIRRADRKPNACSRICSCHFPLRKRKRPVSFEAHHVEEHSYCLRGIIDGMEEEATCLMTEEEAGPLTQAAANEGPQPLSENAEEQATSKTVAEKLQSKQRHIMQLEIQLEESKAKQSYCRDKYSASQLRERVLRMETGLPDRHIQCCGSITYPEALSLEDQVFMTLMKLRHNYTHLHLGALFHCGESTVKNVIVTFIEVLHK
ncbi:hypothetical protein F7725_025378 [Dissostichus mawsoni]|uniref:Transposase Helix-turn-helix domain-containing protein n=1 Tax=Dissostichus mawsoni TaxID=36200 RepID=A0A7J5XAZ4_DISMA|nr:hypothetical protein F7725_025378 [Dissostichus mawsoni]